LRASYESAKEQLAKAGFSEASHPFVLEDTSVRIDALSTAHEEVPGVDIKYWMEDHTFASLDKLLRDAGNDRRATVRSDVLLHVPSSVRSGWGVETDFLVFTGEQRGAIVEAECLFDANLVYPWLDNRSFNKWFVPNGVDKPVGSLSIEIADTVDFRRKSFEPLFDFLERRRYFAIPTVQFQLQLQLDRKPNIILCGYTCSGKTTASQHLARRFGYMHIEASDFMHLAYYYRHGYRGPTAIGDFAESALAQRPTIASEKIVDYMLDHLGKPIVISGFRAPAEIESLENAMIFYGKKFVRRFVQAGEAIRFARLKARARPGDALTIEQFQARDLQQRRKGLGAIEQLPQTLSLQNEESLQAYLEEIDRHAEEGGGDEIDIESGLAAAARISEVGLQDAILTALLSVYKNDEARQFYTTTAVSALIAQTFPAIRRKHKDNVSRYFNQDFYGYYEISSVPGSATRKYRLSNTGYGMAVSTLRALLKLQESI
jgi:dephospho-CoA kinase/inosine/xanthosine triphosphate pyrophosphatase family protein